MREIRLDPSQKVPEIDARVVGKRISAKVHLVFDTGSGITQLDTAIVENIGYSARDAEKLLRVRGAAGEPVEGYVIKVKRLALFGLDFRDVPVLCYDFDNFPEIDGLLGFDLIRQLHLELIGSEGILKVF